MVRCPGNVRKLLEFVSDYDVRKWKHCWIMGSVEKPTVSAFEGTAGGGEKSPGRVHNPRIMRVLIADRNARLLESISRTFARQFTIRTATSCEQCNDLVAGGEFDLVLISEKLSDGLGLQLLGQVARNSPDTLRVFAARRSRLQLLKGKLGPFGLFRTLSYPINPQELLSTLTLAQTGLAIPAPASETPDAQPQEQAPGPPATPAEVHPVVERISLTSSDATFTIDVPKTILSQKRVRRSSSRQAARSQPDARQAPAPASHGPKVAPGLPSNARQSQKDAIERSRAIPQSDQRPDSPRPTRSRAGSAYSAAPARLPSQSRAPQHAVRSRRAANRPIDHQPVYPTRSKVVLAATSVVVFLVTTLTLNLNDASVHVTRASIPATKIDLPPPPEPPAALAPAFRPEPTVARRVEPKPAMDPVGEQVTANNTPTADPSTFGHEAYEVIYDN